MKKKIFATLLFTTALVDGAATFLEYEEIQQYNERGMPTAFTKKQLRELAQKRRKEARRLEEEEDDRRLEEARRLEENLREAEVEAQLSTLDLREEAYAYKSRVMGRKRHPNVAARDDWIKAGYPLQDLVLRYPNEALAILGYEHDTAETMVEVVEKLPHGRANKMKALKEDHKEESENSNHSDTETEGVETHHIFPKKFHRIILANRPAVLRILGIDSVEAQPKTAFRTRD